MRRDHVQKLTACRQAQLIDVQQQAARQAQALIDSEAPIQIRIVDEAFPAHRRARLFEIHSHDDLERFLEALTLLHEACGVFHRGVCGMNGARTDYDGQTMFHTVEDSLQSPTCLGDVGGRAIGECVLPHQFFGGGQLPYVANA